MEQFKDGDVLWAKFGSECFWPAKMEKDSNSKGYVCHFLGEETFEPLSTKLKLCCWGCKKESKYKESSKKLPLIRQHVFQRGLLQAERLALSASYQRGTEQAGNTSMASMRSQSFLTPQTTRQKSKGFRRCDSESSASRKTPRLDNSLELSEDVFSRSMNKESSEPAAMTKTREDDWDLSPSENEKDDDDLPPAFTPTTKGQKDFTFGDVIWAKFRRYPYWPAVFYSTCKKKLKKGAWVSFFDECSINGGARKLLPVSLRCIEPYGCDEERRQQLEEDGKSYRGAFSFTAALEQADDFIRKRALGKVTDFFDCGNEFDVELDKESKSEESEEDCRTLVSVKHSPVPLKRDTPKASWLDLLNQNIDRELRPKTKIKRHQNLLDAIRTTKETLVKISRRQIQSERHRIFVEGSTKEKNKLRFASGFGPIRDEETQSLVMELLIGWFKDACSEFPFNPVTYISDVWLPEAMILGISKEKKLSLKNAEKLYLEG